MADIRNARFYVVEEGLPGSSADAVPLEYEAAVAEARRKLGGGQSVRVLYTEEASQMEITGFVAQGIPTELVSGA